MQVDIDIEERWFVQINLTQTLQKLHINAWSLIYESLLLTEIKLNYSTYKSLQLLYIILCVYVNSPMPKLQRFINIFLCM